MGIDSIIFAQFNQNPSRGWGIFYPSLNFFFLKQRLSEHYFIKF